MGVLEVFLFDPIWLHFVRRIRIILDVSRRASLIIIRHVLPLIILIFPVKKLSLFEFTGRISAICLLSSFFYSIFLKCQVAFLLGNKP